MNALVAEADVKTSSVVMYAYKSVCILCQILMQPVIQSKNFVGGTVTDVLQNFLYVWFFRNAFMVRKVVFNEYQNWNLLFNHLSHLFKNVYIICRFKIYFILIYVIFKDLEIGTVFEVAILYS